MSDNMAALVLLSMTFPLIAGVVAGKIIYEKRRRRDLRNHWAEQRELEQERWRIQAEVRERHLRARQEYIEDLKRNVV